MMFYPILLKSKTKDYLWGGTRLHSEYGFEMTGDKCAEAWVLSCHKDGQSEVINGEMSGKTLTEVLSLWGKEALGKKCERFEYFPILVKLIDAKDKLSVQVHPSDEFALKVEGEYGKTEMWYILDAKEDSSLIYGFEKDVTKEQFEKSIKDGTLLNLCKTVKVKKGDVFFIAPGTLHAIGEGILLCEVQQNSNTTYRVFDYDRVGADGKKRDLHIEKALKVTNTNKNENTDFASAKEEKFDGYSLKNLAKCEYFDVSDMKIETKAQIFEEDTFVSLVVTDGKLKLTSENVCFDAKRGDSIFVPAGVKCTLDGRASVVVSKI